MSLWPPIIQQSLKNKDITSDFKKSITSKQGHRITNRFYMQTIKQ